MATMDDFGLSDEQRMMQQSVAGLLARVLPPERMRALDAAGEFPHQAYDALAQAGWMGLPYREEYGGLGGSRTDLAVLVEAIGRHSQSLASAYLSTVIYGGMHLQTTGSEFLRQTYIPKICAGEIKAAFALSEPDTGSDASGIKLRAVRSGNGYVLSGQKLYITCAHVADYLLVVAKTDLEARHKGVTLFWVDARTKGVTMRPIDTMGRRTSHPNEIFLEDVFVPADHLVGEENRGWSGLMKGLNYERLCIAAASCGSMRHAIDYARDYAVQRQQFGQPISKFQIIQHKFADMRIMYQTARAMTYRVAAMIDAGLEPVEETAIAKIVASENDFKCADLGLQIMGGAGYTMAHDMQRLFRDSRLASIGGGTNDIHRNTIAKLMGL
jgi:alkylation response protein AidB-like acyl-CoA dehydrogenase